MTVFDKKRDLRAPAMRARRFPFGQHEVSSRVDSNSGWSAAADKHPLLASTLATSFSRGLSFVENSWESVA
jgi:hypothetical protein